MGYFEEAETRARLIEILAEFIESEAPSIPLVQSMNADASTFIVE
jgi:hypothetical protein